MVEEFSYPSDEFLLIGKIAGAHGLKGEVRIFSLSGQPENLRHYPKLTLVAAAGELSRPYAVEGCRVQGKMAVARLHSVHDRTRAESLAGMGVLVHKQDLPLPGNDEFYLYQLEGLPVFTTQGERLGVVTQIFSNGAQELLVVRDAGKEYLIPVLDSIVVSHDSEKIVVDPPPGLLQINSGDDQGGPWAP